MSETQLEVQKENQEVAESEKKKTQPRSKCQVCGGEYHPSRIPEHYLFHIGDLFTALTEVKKEVEGLKAGIGVKEAPQEEPKQVKVKDVKPLLDTVMNHVKDCPDCRKELGEWLTANSKTFADWFVPKEQRQRLRL